MALKVFVRIAETIVMKHVQKIQEMFDAGDRSEASNALETLLALGPNNIEALKMKAMLFSSEGRFQDEEKTWFRIAEIDREDPDAIAYFYKKRLRIANTTTLPTIFPTAVAAT